ncbi:hypothetical protein IL306_012362 [Fusarium sp. DS 682]|nr:hypothetical protein IL306_012362 [Fusarium sp. DS 682]
MAVTVQPHGLAMAQLVSSIIFGILSTIVMFLRLLVRFQHSVFGVDDALMTVGYATAGHVDGRWSMRVTVSPGDPKFLCVGGILGHRLGMRRTARFHAVQDPNEDSDQDIYQPGAWNGASVATMIRMPYMKFYFHPEKDYLYRVCNVALWCLFETGIGVIAGSLPPLRKLVKRWGIFDSTHGHSSGVTPYASNNTLGVTTKVGVSSRNKSRMATNGGTSTGGEWERLDDDSSKRRIHVTVDMEMHTMENGAASVGSHESIEELARQVR